MGMYGERKVSRSEKIDLYLTVYHIWYKIERLFFKLSKRINPPISPY
jgi:hypothetical protein